MKNEIKRNAPKRLNDFETEMVSGGDGSATVTYEGGKRYIVYNDSSLYGQTCPYCHCHDAYLLKSVEEGSRIDDYICTSIWRCAGCNLEYFTRFVAATDM